MTRFGLRGLLPATVLARRFHGEARALLAGLAAHSMQPLSAPGTSAFALVLGMLAHAVGWPIVEGGARASSTRCSASSPRRGADRQTGRWVERLDDLPRSRVTLLDLSARGVAELAGDRLPLDTCAALRRFRYGPGACKVDWALDGPVPGPRRSAARPPTLHLGGTFEEIARSEADVAAGRHPERPFCIAVQPCVVDPSRAPDGQHTFYAYCHVPARLDRRHAGAHRGARSSASPPAFATACSPTTRRPPPSSSATTRTSSAATSTAAPPPSGRRSSGRSLSLNPYRTPDPRLYICSASHSAGGGVHGMCGVGAARSALRHLGL